MENGTESAPINMKNTTAEPKILGSLLERNRRKSGRTQLDVAIELGVTQQVIAKWESGDVPKTFRHLPRLAELYGVEPADFLEMKSLEVYHNLCADFRELVEMSGLSVMERNLETVRLSREILKWQTYFATGNFTEADDADEIVEERSKQREIDAVLDSMLAGA